MNKLEAYMRAYLFELEERLNDEQSILKQVHFHLDEANTDKELKSVLKKFIEKSLSKISLIKEVDDKGKKITIDANSFEITKVLIPKYSEEIKKIVKDKKSGVFTNPDMIWFVKIEGVDYVEFIELKSTKEDKIPGSSIQQVEPDEWLIFVRHNDSGTKTITGQYRNSISGTMQFPDRSPRPQVSFNKLVGWINSYRAHLDGVLEIKEDKKDEGKKELLTDWQGVLSRRWLNVLLSNRKKKGEPWFNNNLRKFALDLLKYYGSLDDKNKGEFVKKITQNIIQED